MPDSNYFDEAPKCDLCGRYGDWCEKHQQYLCEVCEIWLDDDLPEPEAEEMEDAEG